MMMMGMSRSASTESFRKLKTTVSTRSFLFAKFSLSLLQLLDFYSNTYVHPSNPKFSHWLIGSVLLRQSPIRWLRSIKDVLQTKIRWAIHAQLKLLRKNRNWKKKKLIKGKLRSWSWDIYIGDMIWMCGAWTWW